MSRMARLTIISSLLLSSMTTNANALDLSQIQTKGGGLQVGSKSDPNWFDLDAYALFDQTLFIGSAVDKGKQYHSGAHIRSAGIDVSGGLGQDLSYTLKLDTGGPSSQFSIEDAYLTYAGFGKNLELSAGQVNPGFSLEKSSSTKHLLFLERSLGGTAFGPKPGLGLSANKWGDNYSITAALTQPKHNVTLNANTDTPSSDRFNFSIRGVYAPILATDRVLHFGASGHLEDDNNAGIEFKTTPAARTRIQNSEVLSTTSVAGQKILASSHRTISLELASQNGPWIGMAELQRAYVNRTAKSRVHFTGYDFQVGYMLCGENRTYDMKFGTFKNPKPKGDGGALEIAARYGYLNLNNKDLHGGKGRNAGVSLNWFVNPNVRISADYIRSRLHERQDLSKRKLHIFGLRMQLTT